MEMPWMINRCKWNKVRPLTPSWKSVYFIFDVNVKGVEEGSVLIKNSEQKVSEMSRRHWDESGWVGCVSRAHEILVWEGEKTWTEQEWWWEGALEVKRGGEGEKVRSDRVAEQKEDGKCEQMLETVEVKDKVEEGKELECPLQALWRSFTSSLIPAPCACVCVCMCLCPYAQSSLTKGENETSPTILFPFRRRVLHPYWYNHITIYIAINCSEK